MNNHFKIIIPSYNNEEWVEYNVASILNQTYTNYSVLYINDASTDNTYNSVIEIVKDYDNWTVINSKENKGAAYNYVEYVDTFVNDNDILIHLDGDDWFVDETVLEQLNEFYTNNSVWMTYGGFLCWDGSDDTTLPYPQSTPYPDFIHNHKLYRRDLWRASHLRTFRGFLFKSINKQDLKSKINNEYYWHASDLAWQYPCLEMCPKDKIGVVDFYTCVYNQSKSNAVRTKQRESVDNIVYEQEIRNRKSYKEGLSGEKLPQVNVFPADYYMEYCNVPTKFTFCYEQLDGEFDMVLLCDPAIEDFLTGKLSIQRSVPIAARLLEQRDYWPERKLYNLVKEHWNRFDVIYTFDRELLKVLPNAVFLPPTEITQFNRLPNPQGHEPYKSDLFNTYELPKEALTIYPKNKLVSAVVSTKAFLPGHVKRLNFIKSIQNKIDLYGRGIREIPSKLDALKDYMFSVAIENVSCDDNYCPWRVFTTVLYLNDDIVGGETHFPTLDVLVTPKSKKIVGFHCDESHVHGVMPVTSGYRKAFIMWFK